jgi:hypothetical protein
LGASPGAGPLARCVAQPAAVSPPPPLAAPPHLLRPSLPTPPRRYDFTDGDLSVSLAQMREFLEQCREQARSWRGGGALSAARGATRNPSPPLSQTGPAPTALAPNPPQVPYKVLRFLFTEINYGGRVTDDKDRRLMAALVARFCGPQARRRRPGSSREEPPERHRKERSRVATCSLGLRSACVPGVRLVMPSDDAKTHGPPPAAPGPQVLEEGAAFSPCGAYVVPGCETVKEVRAAAAAPIVGAPLKGAPTTQSSPNAHASTQPQTHTLTTARQFVEHVATFPLAPSPDIFGLHDNADITCQQAGRRLPSLPHRGGPSWAARLRARGRLRHAGATAADPPTERRLVQAG